MKISRLSLCSATLLSLVFGVGESLFAQGTTYYNPVTAAIPSLQISADARASALGDQGVSTSADGNAQYWNAAKVPFATERSLASLSYTPWLSSLVDDIALYQIAGHYQIGTDRRHTISGSLRYFDIGEVVRWDELGTTLGTVHPNELTVDLSYAYKLSRYHALSLGVRYIQASKYGRDGGSASRLVMDISTYTERPIKLFSHAGEWRLGASVRNIGGKISFDAGAHSSFLPTNLSVGSGLSYFVDQQNKLSVNVELNKLLVPTPPIFSEGMTAEERQSAINAYEQKSALSGIFSSLSDAPGGLGEELKEIRYSIGAEYAYNNQFFFRAGYSYLHPEKGNLASFNLGAGAKWRGLQLDASYLIATSAGNPLDKTLRFTLTAHIEELKNLFK